MENLLCSFILIFRLFQCRVDPELRQVQCNLKAMLMRQYNALGKSRYEQKQFL
jgi:hypothetical protein